MFISMTLCKGEQTMPEMLLKAAGEMLLVVLVAVDLNEYCAETE